MGAGVPATNAELDFPAGIVMDGSGNLFIGDIYNQCIRVISPAGYIYTYAGTPLATGYTGDGGKAYLAKMNTPNYLHLDPSRNLIVVDNGNHVVRKIMASDTVITTIAGDNIGSFGGDGGPATNAKLYFPGNICYDAAGNMYIADNGNNRIRVVNTSGYINTYAGTGAGAFCCDGDLPLFSKIWQPVDLAFDTRGYLDIVDLGNSRIRQILPDHAPVFTNGDGDIQTMTVCENSVGDSINTQLEVEDSDALQTVVWSLFSGASHGTVVASYTTASTSALLIPAGLYYTPAAGYAGLDSFRVLVTDSFKTDTAKIIVTINPAPTAITGSTTLYTGSTTTLSDGTPGGTWSSQNTTIATIGATTGFVTAASAGIDTISYSFMNTCGTALYYITVWHPGLVPTMQTAGTFTLYPN